MRGRIVHVPPREPEGHSCRCPVPWVWRRWPLGTVWECGCGIQWRLGTNSRTGGWVWRRLPVGDYIEDE